MRKCGWLFFAMIGWGIVCMDTGGRDFKSGSKIERVGQPMSYLTPYDVRMRWVNNAKSSRLMKSMSTNTRIEMIAGVPMNILQKDQGKSPLRINRENRD
jgi:hypothetical protein